MNDFWSKEKSEKRSLKLESIIHCVSQDFHFSIAEISEDEAKELLEKLKKSIIKLLYEIKTKVENATIIPEIPLRLSFSDAPVEFSPRPKTGGNWRIGFLATTGNPVFWGHILLALRCIAEFDLNTIILQVMGDHPHKRGQKLPKKYRHAIARRAVEYFYPLIRYTPLGYNNMKIGEENAAEFLILNQEIPLDLYLIIGGDVKPDAVRNVKACNELLSAVEKEEGKDLNIKILIGDRYDSEHTNIANQPEWVIYSKKRYQPLKYKNIPLSSTLFRTYPHLPILPSVAFSYIKQHNLYISEERKTSIHKKEKLNSIVILSYLTPTLHSIVENHLTEVHEVNPHLPHGVVGNSGFLGQNSVTVFKAAGKETSILPVMQKLEVKVVLAIGLCGGLQASLRVGDIIIPTAAIRGEGITAYWADPRLPALTNYELLEHLRQAAISQGIRPFIGPLYTTASLARERQVLEQFAPLGILGVEMELAVHYILATLFKKRAASMYIVSDNVALGDEIIRDGISESQQLHDSINTVVSIIEKTLLT